MARRSKRTRGTRGTRDATRGASGQAGPPPFPYPEGPSGFRLRWLNTTEAGDPDAVFVVDTSSGARKIGQFTRNLPEDLYERTQWIERHIVRNRQGAPPDDWCGILWHGLHHGWQFHRERGVQGFLTGQIEAMGGLEEVHKLGGMYLSVTVLPEGRKVQRFTEPHIVLALEPDGEFCRILVTEYWGPCAIGISAEKTMPTILGPVSVGVVGTVLVDGKRHPDYEGNEPTVMLLDPLTVLGDFGPVQEVADDGLLLYDRPSRTERLYHPDSELARRHMHNAQLGFLDLWDGRVPGYTGRVGKLRRKIAEGEEAERRERAKMPTNPQYMEALERQLQTARFMHDNRPIATVQRQMGRPPHRQDYDAIIADALESAVTHYWTPQMCALLAKSYPTLPEFWLKPQELGPRRGYMWFAEPIPLVEDDPEVLRALMWVSDPDTGHLMIVPFTVFQGPRADEYVTTFRTYHGVPRQVQLWENGQTLTDWLGKQVGEELSSAAALAGQDVDALLAQRIAWGRIFATAVAIMGQTLVKVEPYGADRTSRKRIDRLRPPGLEPPHPLVKAVLLRRQYTVRPGIAPDSEPTDWSCQWVVHEHWRQQFYPSTQEHKWILIADHIKGPPNKPLKDPLPIRLVGR